MRIAARDLKAGDCIWQNGFPGISEGWYGPTIVEVEVGDAVVVIRTWNGGCLPYPADQELEVDRIGLDNPSQV